MEKVNKVTYICQDCHELFEVAQGSRRRFCDSCWLRHMKEGALKGGRPKK